MMETYVLWVPYVVLTILSFILLCVSFLRYRTRKLKKKRYQAFLIRRKNELHLIEQGLYEYNARVDSIYSLGEIVRVFKYKDAQNVIKIYPELLSVENQSVVVKVEDGSLETCKEDNEPTKTKENKETETKYKKESKVLDKRQRPFSTTSRNTYEEKELEVIKL